MKRTVSVIAALIALGICVVLSGAESFTLGKVKLSADVIDISSDSLVAKGDANLVMLPSAPLEIGRLRVDSMAAHTISIQLFTDKARKTAMKTASATGGVVIRGKRADKETDESGKTVRLIRDVYAKAQKAVMPEGKDVMELTGDVSVKVTEPGVPEPILALTGDFMTISMKDGNMRIEKQGGKQSEFTLTPKEEPKK